MLFDPSAQVRAIACHGVCRVCATYWELLPSAVTRHFLSKLVTDLAVDSASVDVRCAVIKVCSVFVGIFYTLVS